MSKHRYTPREFSLTDCGTWYGVDWESSDDGPSNYVQIDAEDEEFCNLGSDLVLKRGGSYAEAWQAYCARLEPIVIQILRTAREFEESEEGRRYLASVEESFRQAEELQRRIYEAPAVPEVPFPRGSVLSRIWLETYIAAEGIL